MVAPKSSISKPKPRPTPVTITMPPRDYQPTKAEHEAEIEMPGATLSKVKAAFFRPVKVKKDTKPTR